MSREEDIREQFNPVKKLSVRSTTNLIGLSGYARSGKDTLGKILQDDYGYTPIAFADKVRELAYEAGGYSLRSTVDKYGWDYAKDYLDGAREVLQNLGVGCRNVIHPDVWVRALFDDLDPFDLYVVTDVRFQNEADMIRNLGGQVWRIVRPNNEPINAHVSETALDDYEFDRVLRNDGSIEDLRKQVLRAG